jgi:hypothetical protein
MHELDSRRLERRRPQLAPGTAQIVDRNDLGAGIGALQAKRQSATDKTGTPGDDDRRAAQIGGGW